MSFPIDPPQSWFERPPDGIPTDRRVTIEPTGQVYGYIALWNTCHVGHAGCVKPPKGSPSDYEYAHQGETLTAEGGLIKTAVIAGGGGHAPVDMKTAAVPKYYENTGTQLMRVRYGEDENGLWFAGALWPDVEELQVAQIRASSMSGDWRFHAAWRKSGGKYDFAGSCLVNIPGFPMQADGDLGSSSGVPYALAASNYIPLDNVNEDCLVWDGKNLTENLVASGEPENMDDCECQGDKTKCSCEEEVEVETSAEDILAAVYQLVGKRMKKKPHTIKADADVEEEVDVVADASDYDRLSESITEIRKSVDWLVSEKLAQQILEEN